MRVCHIYKITNPSNEKCYIGSSVDVKDRFNSHRRDLKSNKHPNIKLQRAFNLLVGENFRYEILHECDSSIRDFQEAFYIEKYQSCDPDYGYNFLKIDLENGVKIVPQEMKDRISKKKMGQKRSEETRRKIGLAHKGQKRSPETCRRISEATKGHHIYSAEDNQKNRERQLGKKRSEETRKNMSLAQKNRPQRTPHTKEAKEKIKIARKNQIILPHTEESKRKIGEKNKLHMTAEARQKLSEMNKKRWLKKESSNAS